jgi:hypothetical protein
MTRHFRTPNLRCGDIVVDTDDERLGRVEATRHGAFALVCWFDGGHKSEVPLVRLKRVEK